MTKETKILTGLLAGAAIGVGIALILSSDKEGELKEKLSELVGGLIDKSKDIISNTKDKVSSLTKSAQDTYAAVENA